MHEGEWVYLERDCDALMVPSAVPFSIPGGTEVQIVQLLGGHVTVNVRGNLARIDKSDADALGIDTSQLNTHKEKPEGPLILVEENDVWAQLKTVYDPEIPTNIVALGLVYSVRVEPQYEQDVLVGNTVLIDMTLTAPGCGMGPIIACFNICKISASPFRRLKLNPRTANSMGSPNGAFLLTRTMVPGVKPMANSFCL